MATQSEELASELTRHLCREWAVEAPREVEISIREKDGRKAFFLLNSGEDGARVKLPDGVFREVFSDKKVIGEIEIKGMDVLVLISEDKLESIK